MVREGGLEPPRLSAYGPQPYVSAIPPLPQKPGGKIARGERWRKSFLPLHPSNYHGFFLVSCASSMSLVERSTMAMDGLRVPL